MRAWPPRAHAADDYASHMRMPAEFLALGRIQPRAPCALMLLRHATMPRGRCGDCAYFAASGTAYINYVFIAADFDIILPLLWRLLHEHMPE